jgi:hypothetical protein
MSFYAARTPSTCRWLLRPKSDGGGRQPKLPRPDGKPLSAVLPYGPSQPSNRVVDGRLLLGAALFGGGWGLAGVCPGPAVVSFGAALASRGSVGGLQYLFLPAMLAGMAVHDAVTAPAPLASVVNHAKGVTTAAPSLSGASSESAFTERAGTPDAAGDDDGMHCVDGVCYLRPRGHGSRGAVGGGIERYTPHQRRASPKE